MPSMNNLTESPRKELHVFYVLDSSGSMENDKISSLNHTMEECIEKLKSIAKKNGDAKLKIAVLEFNTSCKWVTSNGPEDLEEDFEFEFLKAGGLTDIGAALKELNSKLSRHAFLNSMTGALMPVIIFFTDGFATDDYEGELAKIRKNRWFANATKIGIAFGDDADVAMISSVVGDCEAVIKPTELDLLERLMKFVSVTATMLVSRTATTDTVITGADIMKQAREELNLPDDAIVHLEDDEYDKEPDPPIDDGWDDGEW